MNELKNIKIPQGNGVLPCVSSSTGIEPISCELSEGVKAHIEMLEWSNKLFDEARKQLMIPKEMFGSK